MNYETLDSRIQRADNDEAVLPCFHDTFLGPEYYYCCDQAGDKYVTPDWKGPGWYRITGQAGTKIIGLLC